MDLQYFLAVKSKLSTQRLLELVNAVDPHKPPFEELDVNSEDGRIIIVSGASTDNP